MTKLMMFLLMPGLLLIAIACGDGDTTEYEVNVEFNTSVTQDDLDEAEAILRMYDDDLEFLIQESFPPTGRAFLKTDADDFCSTIETDLEAKVYVEDVLCFGGGMAAPTAPADTPAATIALAETPKPATDGETSGAEGFREFASTLQEALDENDASFLRDRALTEAVVCTAADVDPDGLGGLACEFEGQEFDGFTEARWRSEGGIIPVENAFTSYDTMLANALSDESDDFGDGSVQVYALNIGEDRFDAIIAAIIERPFGVGDEEPRRVVYGTAWVFEGGRWMVQSTLTAFVLGEELLDAAQPVYPNWERYESP